MLGVVVVSSAVGLAGGLSATASKLAHQAIHGHAVHPLAMFGMPLLDVDASSAQVEWVGPLNQRPEGAYPLAAGKRRHIFRQLLSVSFSHPVARIRSTAARVLHPSHSPEPPLSGSALPG